MENKRLLKLSIEEAKRKYPNGFNKTQLVDVSKRIQKKYKIINPIVFGKIENDDDIIKQRNNMIEGNYPASISDCEVVGINGDCGKKCPVYLRGDCENNF